MMKAKNILLTMSFIGSTMAFPAFANQGQPGADRETTGTRGVTTEPASPAESPRQDQETTGTQGTAGDQAAPDAMNEQQRPSSETMGSTQRQGADQGQDSERVREVQSALNSRGFDVGEADGNMGPKTSSALRNFQQESNLQPTGQINQETLSALGIRQEQSTFPTRGEAGSEMPDAEREIEAEQPEEGPQEDQDPGVLDK